MTVEQLTLVTTSVGAGQLSKLERGRKDKKFKKFIEKGNPRITQNVLYKNPDKVKSIIKSETTMENENNMMFL